MGVELLLSSEKLESTSRHASAVSTITYDVAKTFARIAKDLAAQPDSAALSTRIVKLGSTVTGSANVALVRFSANGSTSIAAATGDGHGETEPRMVRTIAEGIAKQAAMDRATVLSNDLTVETRWPEYTPEILAATSIRSILAVPMIVDTEAQENRAADVLVFCASQTDHFTDDTRDGATVLADHAAVALVYNDERDRASNLALALKTSREIGAAMGILMERHKVTEMAAFNLLKSRSQDLNIKVHAIAVSLTTSGELPPLPSPLSEARLAS